MKLDEDDDRDNPYAPLPQAERFMDLNEVLAATGMTHDEVLWALSRDQFPKPYSRKPTVRWLRVRIELFNQSRRAALQG